MITASPRLLLIIRLARPLEPIVPTSKPIGLRQWIWRAFVRSALIPPLLVETALIALYLLTTNAIRDVQVEHLRVTAINDLPAAVTVEWRNFTALLHQVRDLTTCGWTGMRGKDGAVGVGTGQW